MGYSDSGDVETRAIYLLLKQAASDSGYFGRFLIFKLNVCQTI